MNLEITNKLFAVTRVFSKTADIIVSQFGITFGNYELLSYIKTGTNTTTDLAKKTNSSLANITHKTKILEESGLVKRSFRKSDRRIWHFTVTEKGQTTLKLIESVYQKAVQQLYSQFTDSQKEQVLDFLKKLETHLDHALMEHQTELKEYVKGLLKSLDR